MIDGNDVTYMIADDGVYKIKNVTNDVTIIATFEDIPISLTIQHAENVFMKQFVKRGASIKLSLLPAEGWKIKAVTFNGSDVTSELNEYVYTTPAINADAILSVSYESKDGSVVRFGIPGDVDGNGVVNVVDHVKLSDIIMNQNK